MTKFAVIGTNFIVGRFLEAAKDCDDFCLEGIYSRSEERGRKAGEEQGYRNFKTYSSLEELKNSSAEAVYIASPNSLHCFQAAEMLKGCKHVLCEKPGASNYNEWKIMTDEAEKSGKILLEAMRAVFTPGFAVIKENLNKIGTVRKVFLQYCQYSSRYDKFKAGIVENAFRPELSNGALMDLGIYCIEVMVGLFGKPLSVTGRSVILPGSIDGEGTILADYPGMQAIISYSKISSSDLKCEIQGENGSIIWEDVGNPKNVTLKIKGEKDIILYEKPGHDLIYEIKYFSDLIKKEIKPKVYNDITAESLKITDEIRKQSGIIFPADTPNRT